MIGNPRPNRYKMADDGRPKVWRRELVSRTSVRQTGRNLHVQSLLIRWTPRAIQLLGLGIAFLFLRYFLVPLGHLSFAEQHKVVNMDILDLRYLTLRAYFTLRAFRSCCLRAICACCLHGCDRSDFLIRLFLIANRQTAHKAPPSPPPPCTTRTTLLRRVCYAPGQSQRRTTLRKRSVGCRWNCRGNGVGW